MCVWLIIIAGDKKTRLGASNSSLKDVTAKNGLLLLHNSVKIYINASGTECVHVVPSARYFLPDFV